MPHYHRRQTLQRSVAPSEYGPDVSVAVADNLSETLDFDLLPAILSPPPPPPPSIQVPVTVSDCIDYCPGAAQTFGQSAHAFQTLTEMSEMSENLYFPFSCQTDWQMGEWMMTTKASMHDMNRFFQLRYAGVPL